MRVLYLLSHAPHYRESFLRALGSTCELTVVAKPCESANLIPPADRIGYRYVEAASSTMFRRSGLEVVHTEMRLIQDGGWDAICAGWNLRHIARLTGWVQRRNVTKRWVWAGMFYGRRKDSAMLRSFRTFVLNRSDGVLGYSQEVVDRLRSEGVHAPAVAFNNSNVLRDEFVPLPIMDPDDKLNLLCVGRYQARKRIDRLVKLAARNPFVRIRLVGPGMVDGLRSELGPFEVSNIEAYPTATGDMLREHLSWSHLIVMPGALGLLALTAAQAGRPMLVAQDGAHGPEIAIARGGAQPIVDWNSEAAVDQKLRWLFENPSELRRLGSALYEFGRSNYTVENMASVYAEMLQISA